MRDSLDGLERAVLLRKELLEEIGGLPEPQVINKEWLYLLKEETRNSIMIEGFFISEEELEKVLAKNEGLTRGEKEALNYFRTAKFIYELAHENYKQKEFLFGIPLIRQINKSLGYKGELRKGKVRIAGAVFNPPDNYLEEWLKIFSKEVLALNLNQLNFNKLAILHAFFEKIHPFEDGNGRTGRILLNYILISAGYPLVILKGDEKFRKEYYEGLEEIDKQLLKVFKKFEYTPPNYEEINKLLKLIKSTKLRKLILLSLKENLDRLIVAHYEEREKLQPVGILLAKIGYSPLSARKLIERGKIIAIKKGNRWFSTESLIRRTLSKRN